MSDEFESTGRSRILSVVREELNFPVVGEVQAVHPHTGSESIPTNHHVDVAVPPGSDARNVYHHCPVLVSSPESIRTPRAGDLVLLEFLDGIGDDAVVTQIVYGDADEHRAPKAPAGRHSTKRGNLYTELHEEGDWVRVSKKPDDTDSPTTKIEIDDSQATTKVNIDTDGDLVLSADGDILISEGGVEKEVLTKDAVFEYEQRIDTSDGTGGTQTKQTTKVSNNETTSTKID